MARPVPAPPADSFGSEFDRRVQEFDRFSHGMVLLAEVPRPELLRVVREFADALSSHARAAPRPLRGGSDGRAGAALAADHERFLSSVGQLRWLSSILERDDHGGNRQALGQYGKILVEALREHRRREQKLLDTKVAGVPTGSGEGPGQP